MASFEAKKKAYAEIEARFACAHENREIRHRIIKDNRPTYVSQCVRCGHTSTPVKAAEVKRLGIEIPEYDYRRQEHWHRAKSLAYEIARNRLKTEMEAEYSTYRKSPAWEALREKVFERCDNKCELCEKSQATEVHHLTYERIGKEELSDLLGVCRPCHELIHGKKIT